MLQKCFLRCIAVQHTKGKPIGDDWTQITQTEFDAFCFNPKYYLPQVAKFSPQISSSSNTKPSSTYQYNSVELFCGGIKRDATLFPSLKDDKFHDIWHQSFKTQATVPVFNDTYVPTTADDIALFQEKQKYVYAVLESKVQIDRRKAIIWDINIAFDAHKAYQKIKAYHLQSIKSKMVSSVIISYITSSKLGNGTWNGTIEVFIWQNQVRFYKKFVTPSDNFSDGQKQRLLQNTVMVLWNYVKLRILLIK
jgi:hypothetical protein